MESVPGHPFHAVVETSGFQFRGTVGMIGRTEEQKALFLKEQRKEGEEIPGSHYHPHETSSSRDRDEKSKARSTFILIVLGLCSTLVTGNYA